MKRASNKSKENQRGWRFRGICADAEALGVNRRTLYKVLRGIWKSRSLLARYAELKVEKDKAIVRRSKQKTL